MSSSRSTVFVLSLVFSTPACFYMCSVLYTVFKECDKGINFLNDKGSKKYKDNFCFSTVYSLCVCAGVLEVSAVNSLCVFGHS